MQNWPLLVSKLLDHAAATYPQREIVTLTVEGALHRSNWLEIAARSRRLAQWLAGNGIMVGDRVATLAWNTHRHVEAWYGVAGAGAVVHPVNPRLFREQIVYIFNHAEDRVLLFDLTFLPLVEDIADMLPSVEHFIVLTDREHMPVSRLNLLCYEDVVASVDGDFPWVTVDETAAAGLSYTSGTTGNPKGVIYTHRSNVLVSWAIGQVDMFAMSSRTCAMPVVPLYHANGWALFWAAAMFGAKLVLSGPNNDVETIQKLIIEEGVTLAGAVPTIWQAMLQHLDRTGTGLGVLERVVIGGSAAPRTMVERFQRDLGLSVINSWGMTEMSPLGTIGMLCAAGASEPYESQLDLKMKKGRAPFGVELKVTGEDGTEVPRDGRTQGALKVRGPWVVDQYFRGAASVQDENGYFDTGDIATINDRSYMQITDRAKDIVKSGGEWISSIDLENIAIGCPGVAEAAVIGVKHPRWEERPILILVRLPDATVSDRDVLGYLEGRIAKWWTPDAVIFVDEIPHSATGKINKLALQAQFKDFSLAPA